MKLKMTVDAFNGGIYNRTAEFGDGEKFESVDMALDEFGLEENIVEVIKNTGEAAKLIGHLNEYQKRTEKEWIDFYKILEPGFFDNVILVVGYENDRRNNEVPDLMCRVVISDVLSNTKKKFESGDVFTNVKLGQHIVKLDKFDLDNLLLIKKELKQ